MIPRALSLEWGPPEVPAIIDRPQLDQQLCYLDGEILPVGKARIHPLDRGLTFGDGVYEVVKVLDGVPLLLDEHLARLRASLREVRIPEPPALREAALELRRRAGVEEGSLFAQITRGVAPRTHLPPTDLPPTVLILAAAHPVAAPGSEPMAAITRPDWRWGRCDIKSSSLMATVLGKLDLAAAGAGEVIFVGPDGELREGGSTNVFVRRADAWLTHPLDRGVLPGVTRHLLLELAGELGQAVEERAPRLAERGSWREVLVCGTLTGAQAVVRLDGEPVGDGEPGPWTRRLAAALAERERRFVEAGVPAAASA